MSDLLTELEHETIAMLGKIFGNITRIAGESEVRAADLTEAASKVHDLQNMILAQAAAREYSSRYRLLGRRIS